MKMNHYYADLEESYLFSTIAKKVEDYQTGHPDSKIIRMGIGRGAGNGGYFYQRWRQE